MSEKTIHHTSGKGISFRLALAALVITAVPVVTASIGYGGSPVTTAAAMLALGVLAGIDGRGSPWMHLLAAAVVLPLSGAIQYVLEAGSQEISVSLKLVLYPLLYAPVVFIGSYAVRTFAEGRRSEAWSAWLVEHRDGLEAFLLGVIAAAMFPYLSVLWPLGAMTAAGAVSYRYPNRSWRFSIAVTTAFLGIAFLRILSDIIVDVASHDLFPFEFIVAFLLSAPFSFFAAAAVTRMVRKNR